MNLLILAHIGHGPHIHAGDSVAAVILTAIVFGISAMIKNPK